MKVLLRDKDSKRTHLNDIERITIEFDNVKYVLNRDVSGNLTINKNYGDESAISVHPHVN